MDANEKKEMDTSPFEAHRDRYDQWFDRHHVVYLSELLCLRAFVPWNARGLEIGVGTGRFAGPLGVEDGLDPSDAMLEKAASRGVKTIKGVAESLPYADGSFDYVLVITTLCFVQSADRMLAQAHRVLRTGGRLIVGFIDRESDLGQTYLKHQTESLFYRKATFYSVSDVAKLLQNAGFTKPEWGQTLFRPLPEILEIEPLLPGTGKGAFVVVAASRK